jgi:hypothetical protein
MLPVSPHRLTETSAVTETATATEKEKETETRAEAHKIIHSIVCVAGSRMHQARYPEEGMGEGEGGGGIG